MIVTSILFKNTHTHKKKHHNCVAPKTLQNLFHNVWKHEALSPVFQVALNLCWQAGRGPKSSQGMSF